MNSVGRKRGRGGQRGSSLIELAVVMVVVGGLAITAAVLSRNATRATAASADRDLREIAERAVIGYAHANYRLPCPSANQGGLEDCATGQVGLFPWRTVGVPHLAAGMLRYGVYRNPSAASPWLDMDLAVSLHRLRPLFVEGAPPVLPNIALRAGTAPVSLVDFCLAVTRASNTTPVTAEVLAVSTPDAGVAGTTVRRPVAFVIAASGPSDADGDGNIFDGLNATASSAAPTFESANRAQSRTYDDQITAVSFNTLFGQLDCGGCVNRQPCSCECGDSRSLDATGADRLQSAASNSSEVSGRKCCFRHGRSVLGRCGAVRRCCQRCGGTCFVCDI